MNAEVRTAAGTDLNRRLDALVIDDQGFPRNETIESILNLQSVTTFAKTFLHDSSP